MVIRKRVILILSILLISTVAMLSSCNRNSCYAERGINNLLRQIESGNLSNITLRIYTPVLAWHPLTVEEFTNRPDDDLIIIEGVQLEEYINSFRGLKHIELIPVEEASYINARWYFVFEDRHGRSILDVAMWGENDSVFINGIEFERNDIFLEIIVPFLPWYLW